MAKRKPKSAKPKTWAEAAQLARDIYLLRESMRATAVLEKLKSADLKEWLDQHHEFEIAQEGFPTAVLREQPIGYDWDFMAMPDDDVQTLRKLGLLTVKKGEYDAAVKEHGPLGLLQKYGYARYSRQLRFEPAKPKQPKETAHGESEGRGTDRRGGRETEGGGAELDDE